MSNNLLAKLSLIALALTLSACEKAATADEQAPLATVRIETLSTRPLSISSELSGRIAAPRIAEVRARVAGVVLQRTFREGSDVKQGDVLFRIDPTPYELTVRALEAQLAGTQASCAKPTSSWPVPAPARPRHAARSSRPRPGPAKCRWRSTWRKSASSRTANWWPPAPVTASRWKRPKPTCCPCRRSSTPRAR
jgi:hypothetical protein